MFEIVVSCSGLGDSIGRAAVADIEAEFVERPWHQDVHCWWADGLLMLRAKNHYDDSGDALADEFSDAVCACTPIVAKISIRVVSVRQATGSDA